MIGGWSGTGWTSASGDLWNVSTTITTTAKSCDQSRGEKEKRRDNRREGESERERGRERGTELKRGNSNQMQIISIICKRYTRMR